MDVTLHIGAHRCATTSFQTYLCRNRSRLAAQGLGYWGPPRTRAGLFRGIIPGVPVTGARDLHRRARRGCGRVQPHLGHAAGQGYRRVLVSDENMLGSVRENLRLGDLYSGVGERMARFGEAFGDQISDVALNIRSLEGYWTSALTCGLRRGMPGRALLERLTGGGRSWRDVVMDVACALPNANIWVLPFETYAGRPEAQLAGLTDIVTPPKTYARDWLNASLRLPELRALADDLGKDWQLPKGDGRWHPFSAAQIAALQETYADDIMWLVGGAGGIARLLPDPDKNQAGTSLPQIDQTRGRHHDHPKRRLAGAR